LLYCYIIININPFICVDDKDLTLTKYIKQTFNTQGMQGFYKGMGVTMVKIIPYQGLIFFFNERFKALLGYEKFEKH